MVFRCDRQQDRRLRSGARTGKADLMSGAVDSEGDPALLVRADRLAPRAPRCQRVIEPLIAASGSIERGGGHGETAVFYWRAIRRPLPRGYSESGLRNIAQRCETGIAAGCLDSIAPDFE